MKILIIRAGALGDTLMLMPAIHGLREKAQIVIAGRRPGIDYLKPYVDQCVDMETAGWYKLFMEETENLSGLSFPSPDHIITFMNDHGGRIKDRLIACMPQSAVNVFPAFPPERDKAHIALYMARAIEDSGLPIDALNVFEKSFMSPLIAYEPLYAEKKDCIVLHPGSGSREKNYPPHFWLNLIKDLKRSGFNRHGRFILLIGPAEEGLLPFFRRNLDQGDGTLKVFPETEELISILGRASVYIGHDSGVTHLAAMLGTQVIALFKQSSVVRWRPLGPNVRVIKNGDYSLSR